nr:zinc-dependent metalloprotease family protein [Clavibacter sp. VKM Ac-2873]
MSQVDAYYAHETDGAIRVHVASITDWITPDDASVRCDDFDSVNAFALRESGFTPAANAHLMAVTPSANGCLPTSNASEGADVNEGGIVFMSKDDPATFAHELGHNMSLYHASSVQCPTWDLDASQGVPADCHRDEYGDDSDLMGVTPRTLVPFSAGTLDRLGLISHRVVPACGGARRIELQTMSAGFDAQRIVSWADPVDPSVQYFLQYRDAVDGDEYMSVYPSPSRDYDVPASGVQISRTDPLHPEAASTLVRPDDGSSAHQRLAAGDVVPLQHGMSVSVVAMDEDAHVATVDVSVPCGSGGRTVTAAPRADAAPTATQMDSSSATPMAGMSGTGGMPGMSAMPMMPGMRLMDTRAHMTGAGGRLSFDAAAVLRAG